MKIKLLKLVLMLSRYSIYALIAHAVLFNTLLAGNSEAQRHKSVTEVYINTPTLDLTVTEAFQTIEQQTGFSFSYEFEHIEKDLRVHLQGKQLVSKVLTDIARSGSLHFRQVNSVIWVRKKNRSSGPLEIIIERDISGKIVDENGQPLPGVSVLIKGTATGTVTDIDGNFRLSVPDEAEILLFSFVGYQTQEIAIGNQSVVNIQMIPDITTLSDIVVIGYGTQIKRELTSFISSVKAKELQEIPVPGLDQALQGRAAGVQVTKNTGSPGGGVSIRIRGTSSIFSGQEPLYIVDGIPINTVPTGQTDLFGQTAGDGNGQAGNEVVNPIADLSMDDIESIEILKDAASANIYGARAANGVVIITTKRGTIGKPQFSFNGYTGFAYLADDRRYKLLEAGQFTALTNEGRIRNGLPPIYTEAPATSTDWQDEIFRTAPIHNGTLGVTGGTENVLYSVNTGFFRQEGIMLNSEYERFSFRANLDFDASENFKVGTRLFFSRSLSDRLRNNGNASGGDAFNNNNLYGPSLLASALRANPAFPVFDENGGFQQDTLNLVNNPVALALTQNLETRTNRLLGNVFAEWQIIDNLKFRTSFGIDLRDQFDEYFYPPTPGIARGGSLFNGSLNDRVWLTENYFTYDVSLGGDHRFGALAGFSYQEFKSRGFAVQVDELSKDKAAPTFGLYQGHGNQGFQDFAIASYYARTNYAFKSKYLFTASVRFDGSSRFGRNNRYGTFPSASVGWILSDEGFFDNIGFIDFMKLRAGFGITGNDQVGAFENRGTGSAENAYLDLSGLKPDNIDNRDFSWETTEQLDVGLDFTLLGDKLEITADYYIKTTDDLLYPIELPWSAGFSTRTGNFGKIENRGFELGLNLADVRFGDLSWSSNFNISFNRNEVIELANGGEDINFGGRTTLIREGEPISFQAIVIDGINPETGDWLPRNITDEDANGDGIIDDNEEAIDVEDLVIVGSPLPDHFGGFTNTFRYRNFDLNIFFQWSYGNEIVNTTRSFVESVSVGTSSGLTTNNMRQEAFAKRWRGPGDTNAEFRGIDFNNEYRAVRGLPIDQYIEDASYLRLKALSLGYNLPASWLNKLGLTSLRIYSTANNLLTFTDYTGYDPEVNHNNTGASVTVGYDNGTYPQSTSFVFGLNAKF